MAHLKLLTERNYKILKGRKLGYMTYILHLAPAKLSGFNTCPMASAGCRASCLNTSGRGQCPSVQSARIRKTRLFFQHRKKFLEMLRADIASAIRRARRKHMVPCFRLNGTSDIAWEFVAPEIFREFHDVQFYDYTKITARLFRPRPANYHLTFSLSEKNVPDIRRVMAAGYNVVAVFRELPKKFFGRRVFSGDTTDLRFLDPKGVIVGVTPKGKAKRDTSGFVR